MRIARNLLGDDSGATAIEYGLIAALVSIGAIVAMQGLGDQLESTLDSTSEAMAGGSSSSGGDTPNGAGGNTGDIPSFGR